MLDNRKDFDRSSTSRLRRRNVHSSSIYILGGAFEIDPCLQWRIKVGQYGVAVFAPPSLLCYILGGGDVFGLRLAAATLCVTTLVLWGLIFYKNTSLVMIKRLFLERNVVVLVLLAFFNLFIDFYKPKNELSYVMTCLYALVVNSFVFVDAVVRKSRFILLGVSTLILILGTYNAYMCTFGSWDEGVVFFQYAVGVRKYTVMKRSMQRSIHLQILLFSAKAVYTAFSDKKMELMIFGTGQIRRDQVDNREQDHSINTRIKWSQYGALSFTLTGVLCYMFGGMVIFYLQVLTVASAGLGLVCCVMLYYKNFSFPIFKKLLTEANVIIIMFLTIWNFIVVTLIPRTALSPVVGLVYFLVTCAFLFVDAVVQKSRAMALSVGILFILLNLFNLYGSTIDDYDEGIVLFRYTVGGIQHKIMKRSTHQGIYFQILVFSARAVYRLLTDKKMELMIFGTSNIYRTSGTTAAHIKDQKFTDGLDEENSFKWVRGIEMNSNSYSK